MKCNDFDQQHDITEWLDLIVKAGELSGCAGCASLNKGWSRAGSSGIISPYQYQTISHRDTLRDSQGLDARNDGIQYWQATGNVENPR